MLQTQRQPAWSLMMLILLVLVNGLVFSLLGMFIGGVIYGFNTLPDFLHDVSSQMGRLKILQISNCFGMFVAPPLLLARIEGKRPLSYLHLKQVKAVVIGLTILIMIFSMPLLEWTALFNQKMQLPDILKSLEQWMRIKEELATELTKKFLLMPHWSDLLVNLLMLAVLPAIGEEFIFRGCLQRIFARWTKNQHVAIWLTAFIFSAVHLQFFGFIPRMLLGALLGYLLLWSGSLWTCILAHFLNNALVVGISYINQYQGEPVNFGSQTTPEAWYIYLFSFVLTFVLLYIFYKNSIRNKENQQNNGARLG